METISKQGLLTIQTIRPVLKTLCDFPLTSCRDRVALFDDSETSNIVGLGRLGIAVLVDVVIVAAGRVDFPLFSFLRDDWRALVQLVATLGCRVDS